MKIPTAEEFAAAVRAQRSFLKLSSLREGQIICATLNSLGFELTDEIVEAGVDPFYDDSKIPAFYDWLGQRWGW